METKKITSEGFSFKQLLFAYLAVTKVMYWINTINAMDGLGEFGFLFVNRMLNQDIMVIVVLVAMNFLDKYLFRGKSDNDLIANVKLYVIGVVMFVILIAGYHFLLGLFLPVYIPYWHQFILQLVAMFTIISFVLYIKERLKKKESALYLPDADTDEVKLSMLKSLRDADVLTQEEFEEKSARYGGHL